MRISRLLVVGLCAVALGALTGCTFSGRDPSNPYIEPDHEVEHVGQVDTIPMNGR